MNENILQNIISLGKPAVLILQKEIKEYYKKNSIDFIAALESNNIVKAREIKRIGMDWSDLTTWTKIARIWRGGDSSPEITKFIWTLEPDELHLEQSSLVIQDKRYKFILNQKEIFRIFLKENLKDLFNNYTHLPINNYLANWIISHEEEDLLANPKYLKSLCLCISRNKLSENMNFIEIVLKKFPQQLFIFLESASKYEDFNEISKSKVFMQIINQKTDEIETGKNESMAKAVEKGNIEQIKFYHDLGVALPFSKAPYSSLYSKSGELEAMEYIINNIPDITIGSSVILKTVLHHNKFNLVSKILEKYPCDSVACLEVVIDKRKESPSVNIVKATILKMKLDKKLSEKPNYLLMKL